MGLIEEASRKADLVLVVRARQEKRVVHVGTFDLARWPAQFSLLPTCSCAGTIISTGGVATDIRNRPTG